LSATIPEQEKKLFASEPNMLLNSLENAVFLLGSPFAAREPYLSEGHSPASSPNVQLSRAKIRARLSIFRPFDPAKLISGLSKEILAELDWQGQKAKETEDFYM
jgi:hypothetical protein